MIELVISGGQTGADQAGWRAAKAAGISCSGWMPKGFKTEGLYCPEFAEMYGAKEHPSPNYPPRTEANARWADGTLIFTHKEHAQSPGTRAATLACLRNGKPSLLVIRDVREWPDDVAAWIESHNVRVLNVAGNRESKAPGIGVWVEAYLAEVFRLLKEGSR